jgi:hypothetical protein
MTFTWLNKQGVSSDEGFSVQCMSQYSWVYRDGSTVVKPNTEIGIGSGNEAMVIFHSDDFDRGNTTFSAISPLEKARRIRNFRAALAFMNVEAADSDAAA